ncbi:MAG: hypothetical protein IT384_21490, partial [Deltaproteobacteria bacterium]|nr:hypothetical protein [Deltaproteobacteria bacterium]
MAFLNGDAQRRTSWFARGLTVALLFAISCSSGGGGCGGGGCGGCGASGTYRYPLNDPNRPDAVPQSEAARVRITQAFIDFIQPQLPTIIRSALSGGMTVDAQNRVHIPIPDQNDIVDVSVAGIGLLGVDLRQAEALLFLDDLQVCQGGSRSRCMLLEFVETPASDMGVRLALYELRLGIRLKIDAQVLGSDARCTVYGDAEPNDVAAEITLNVLIQPGVGPDPDRNFDVGATVSDVELVDIGIDVAGSGTYCAERNCQDCALEVLGSCLDPGGECNECHLLCGGVLDGVANLASALINLVRPLLNSVLKPIVQNFVNSALGNLNGTPAKMETQISLGDLLPIDAFKASNPFGVFIAPEVGKFPVITRMGEKGMEITVTGGAEGELAECIPALDPFFEAKGPVPVLGGLDDRGRPYHVGLTMAQALMNQMLYAIHRSGSLCLKLSSQDVKELTGGGFSLNASILSLLAADLSKVASDAAPVIVQLKPRKPGRVDLGSGTRTGTDTMGNPIYDWLLKLELDELGIAFHVLIQDRYVRVFEVTSDINVGLNVNVLPDNKLEAALGELRIDNFQETFNELMPNADFAQILPTLLDVALQALLQNQLTFDVDITTAVSSALGGAPIYMRVNEIKRDGAQEDYLTLTLTFSDQPGAPLLRSAETFARLADEPELIERVDTVAHATGRVRLKVGEALGFSDQQALEYQVRVDRGLWKIARAPQSDGTLRIADPRLLLSGEHEIEVRARYRDDYQTLDPSPTQLRFTIDTLAPRVAGELVRDSVEARVSDAGSTPEQVTLRGRFDGGEWFDVPLLFEDAHTARGLVPLAGVTAARLELVGTDAAGNESRAAKIVVG